MFNRDCMGALFYDQLILTFDNLTRTKTKMSTSPKARFIAFVKHASSILNPDPTYLENCQLDGNGMSGFVLWPSHSGRGATFGECTIP